MRTTGNDRTANRARRAAEDARRRAAAKRRFREEERRNGHSPEDQYAPHVPPAGIPEPTEETDRMVIAAWRAWTDGGDG